MNARQLEKLGVPSECVKSAIRAIQNASQAGVLRSLDIKQSVRSIMAAPGDYVDDPLFGEFAREVQESGREAAAPKSPLTYRTWGDSGIEPASHVQMRQACALPMAVGAALMPDAHVGYGLP